MDQNQVSKSDEINKCENTSIVSAVQNGIRIRNVQQDFEIRATLIWIYSVIGLRPESYPTPSEDAVLIKVIREKYSGFTLEEFKIAFMMAVSRELGELNVDHFQMFSAEYLGRVMSAYRLVRSEELKKMNQRSNTFTEEKIPIDQYFLKCLIEPYERLLAGDQYPFSELDGWMLYNRLHKLICLTEEQRNEYKATAKTIVRKERDDSDERYENKLISMAKHLAFKDWIQEKAFDEFDLRGFILEKLKQKKP